MHRARGPAAGERMIGSLRGRLLRVDGSTALIEAGGVGYEVELPGSTLRVLPQPPAEEVFVYIHHIVREDAQQLCGFADFSSRALFRILIKVSGVGPKLALSVLSTFGVAEFIEIVLSGKSASLQLIPGVGKRTAERLMVELKDRLRKFRDTGAAGAAAAAAGTAAGAPGAGLSGNFDEAVAALSSLGYKETESIRYVKAAGREGMTTEELIVAALAQVSKK